MALPWLAIVDGVLGMTDIVRRVRGGRTAVDERLAASGGVEARLGGVVVAALKEAFERDRERLELERERAAEEQRRAERAMRLELLRQAGEREVGRLRLLSILASLGFLAAAFVALRLPEHAPLGRTLLALAAFALTAALAGSLLAQSRVSREMGRGNDRATVEDVTASLGGPLSLWLTAIALVLVFVAALFG